MKKMISICLVLAMLLCGCSDSDISASDQMEGIQARQVSAKVDLEQESPAVTDFCVRLFQNSLKEGENTLISPLSVLYALSMTANGADGETLTQMESVLGTSVDILNSWLRAYMQQLNEEEKLHLANSIWFKDDPNLTIEESFLQTNADYYGAGIYKAAFDRSTRDDINKWVSDNTDGMIEEILNEIPEDAIMYLVNALAFDAEWETVYKEHQVRDGIFTTENGAEQNVTMMHSTENQYLEDENATGFIKYYADRTYAFVALLPNEGISVEEYISGLTGEHLEELLSSAVTIDVYASMPKFETEYDVEMSEILKGMGMPDAFDWTVADFSRMGSYTEGNICINRVLHKTFISVTEQGTRAGAATAVEMVAEGACEVPDYRTVTLDRPFVYMLIDCEQNLPFFVGTMMCVENEIDA